MTLAPRISSLAGPDHVEFTLREFNKLIDDHGYAATWYKATLCPNRDPNQADHHRLDCSLCDENGFVYYDPQAVKCLMTAFSKNLQLLPESRFEPGTAYLTVDSTHKINFWDKFVFTEALARFSEVERIDGLTYRLKYPVDSLVHVVTSEGTEINVGTITIDGEGRIVFGSDPSADGSEFFAVSYLYHPTYIVLDLPHHIRDCRITETGTDTQKAFPLQALVRLDFLVRDEGAD